MKKLSLIILIAIISYGQVGCAEKEEESFTHSAPYYYSVLNKEKKQVICHGDAPSFALIATELYDDGNERDVLAYALIMANKYDNADAYYDVYDILKGLGGCDKGCKDDKLNCLDDKTRAMALEYLKLALEKGALPHAQDEYDRLKSEGVIK